MLMNSLIRTRCLLQLVNKRMMSYAKALKKRFYKDVNINPVPDGFLIQLDKQTIKTPLLNQLFAPTEYLALAVAQEWHSQKTEINIHTMPLTTICNTTIDNPAAISKARLVDELLQFFHTDTICSLTEEPDMLVTFQDEKWLPVRDWFSQRYNITVNASSDLFQLHQTDEAISTMRKHLLDLNKWQLNGLQTAIDGLKSFILPFAVLNQEIEIEEAVYLSRLELEFQIEKWGNFEAVHDVEKVNHQTLLTAGTLVFQLCSEIQDSSETQTVT